MPKTLQFRRDTTANLAAVTGSIGELFVDTTKDTVVVMDGSTAGGFPLAKFTDVTAANLGMKGYVDSVAGGSYSNVQVATYLPTYSGNIANVRLGVSGRLTFPDGTVQTTAAAGGGSSYSNSNVASYLTTGQITISNIKLAPSGNIVFADGTVQTTAAAGSGSSYGNANVASYLPTYLGNISAANVWVNSGAVQISDNSIVLPNDTSSLSIGQTFGNSFAFSTSFVGSNWPVLQIRKSTFNASSFIYAEGLSVNDFSGNTTQYFFNEMRIISGSNVTVANTQGVFANAIYSTGGFFWANGTPYSTGSASLTLANLHAVALSF